MTVRIRQEIERKIVECVIDSALVAGYHLGVNDGEERTVKDSVDKAELLAALFTTDEDYLIVRQNGKDIGWVFFVYGNDGYDVINDYTTNLETAMKEANLLGDYYSEDGEYVTFEEWKAAQKVTV